MKKKEAQSKHETSNPSQFLVKLISLGDVEVGKSCLIKRYCEGHFILEYITTIGIDYGVKKINYNDAILAINIFDLSGDDDFKTVRKQFYNDALVNSFLFKGILLVYDVNIKATFDNLSKWESELISNGIDLSKSVILLIGNKTDTKTKKEVTTQVGKDYAKSKGYYFYECSAKSGQNVEEAFQTMLKHLYNKTIENKVKYVY